MTVLSIRSRLCRSLSATALWAMVPGLSAQLSRGPAGALTQSAAAKQPQERLRSQIFVYDLHDGTSRMVYTADAVWEAPSWSPDGKYLISNSGGGIYKLFLKQDGAVEAPQRLAIPMEYRCNNDKAISPDGRKLGFSATRAPHEGSQVFLADADGSDIKLLAEESPSYFPRLVAG